MVLFWLSEMPADLATNDPLVPPEVIAGVIQHVTSIMTTYQQKGFTNAANTHKKYLHEIIRKARCIPGNALTAFHLQPDEIEGRCRIPDILDAMPVGNCIHRHIGDR